MAEKSIEEVVNNMLITLHGIERECNTALESFFCIGSGQKYFGDSHKEQRIKNGGEGMAIEDVMSDIREQNKVTRVKKELVPKTHDKLALLSMNPLKVTLMYATLTYAHQEFPPVRRESDIETMLSHNSLSYRVSDSYGTTTTYHLTQSVPDFIIGKESEYGEKYYHFRNTQIRMDFKTNGSQLWLCAPPYTNAGYNHPFVFSDGRFCYGNFNFYRDKGIDFNEKRPLTETEYNGRKIGITLSKARDLLEISYFGNSFTPVRRISSFTHIATNIKDAERYALQKNISPTRIFHNG